ncbi:Uncharacterised protein [Vibrio cholerae]|nr:Uncharacterised protein [Vibrio cholerae]CSH96230.1 Uncharacterised protein [Vibrio cholerae]
MFTVITSELIFRQGILCHRLHHCGRQATSAFPLLTCNSSSHM